MSDLRRDSRANEVQACPLRLLNHGLLSSSSHLPSASRILELLLQAFREQTHLTMSTVRTTFPPLPPTLVGAL